MKQLFKSIKENIFPHHTENNVLNIQIIQGKDHQHLIIKIRNIEEVLEITTDNKYKIISKINQFLNIYETEEINYETDKERIKKKLEDNKE